MLGLGFLETVLLRLSCCICSGEEEQIARKFSVVYQTICSKFKSLVGKIRLISGEQCRAKNAIK